LHGRGASQTVRALAHVVCLIADPERTPLDGVAVAALERAPGSGARWLSDDEAGDGRALRARIEAALGNPAYDVGIVPAGARQKRLLVSDMDATVITVERVDELAEHLGGKAQVNAIRR
jgi:phosphoserine phosphatase